VPRLRVILFYYLFSYEMDDGMQETGGRVLLICCTGVAVTEDSVMFLPELPRAPAIHYLLMLVVLFAE
jgi:hypothetical protein